MREQPRDASQQRRGGAQASCSKFLYWIKAARYADRARWRPKAADAPVYRPALGSPRQLSAQDRKRPDTAQEATRPTRSSTTRPTPRQRPTQPPRPGARDQQPRHAESAVTPRSSRANPKQGSVAQAGCGGGGTHGACSPQRGNVTADFRWLRPNNPPAPTARPRRHLTSPKQSHHSLSQPDRGRTARTSARQQPRYHRHQGSEQELSDRTARVLPGSGGGPVSVVVVGRQLRRGRISQQDSRRQR